MMNNTMNNNNYNSDNNNESTMSDTFDNTGSGLPIAGAVPSTPAQQQQQRGRTSSALYKMAARNLREYHGVPSMTALKLEKTVALLGLRPRRLVAQGLAPRRLLKDNSSPLVLAGDSSGEDQEELCEAVPGALMRGSGDNPFNSSSEDIEEEEEKASNSTYDDNGASIGNIDSNGPCVVQGVEADGNSAGDKQRPIHAALVAGGINLQPRETRPLLRALGVNPHRLIKLGLVKREAIRAMAGRRDGDPGSGQRLRAGGPGMRGVAGPRGPPHGPPHAHRFCGRPAGGGPSRPVHGPPRRPFHGSGHHLVRRGGEGGEEGASVPHGPHGGPGHRGPRHHGGRLQGSRLGPGHHGMTAFGHRGPHGGDVHGHGHSPPHHGHGHGHGHCDGGFHSAGEGGGGEGLLGGAAHGPGKRGPPRHRGWMGRSRSPPHGPPRGHHNCGPWSGDGASGPVHGPPRRPFHGHGHHGMHPMEESGEEGMPATLAPHGGPGHGGPRHHGGGMSRSRGRPPFHGLCHEGASGAPPGMMAHRRDGSPCTGGGGMNQRGGRLGGGAVFCGGGFGGGGDVRHRGRAHLAHFHGVRHQPQLEAY